MIDKLFAGLVCSAMLFAIPVVAQDSVDRAVIAKIRDEGLNRSQVLRVFTHLPR